MASANLMIKTLGPSRVPSPLKGVTFIPKGARILVPSNLEDARKAFRQGGEPPL